MGDGNLTQQPGLFAAQYSQGHSVKWPQCLGTAVKEMLTGTSGWKKQPSGSVWGLSSGYHLTTKGPNVLSWRNILGHFTCHHIVFIQGGECSREPTGPMVSPFLETLGSAGVRPAKRDEFVRLLPTLAFFIMPCCSWFWEGLCPHTK